MLVVRYELPYISCFSRNGLNQVVQFAERVGDGLGMSEKLLGSILVAVSAVFQSRGDTEGFDESRQLVHVGDASFFKNFDFEFAAGGGVNGEDRGLVE